MAKQKTAFVCNDCGSDYAKWQGQCSDCGAWNTLAEIRLGPATSGSRGAGRAGGGAGANRAGFAGALAGARILKDIDLDLPADVKDHVRNELKRQLDDMKKPAPKGKKPPVVVKKKSKAV